MYWIPDFIGLNELIEKVKYKFTMLIYFRCNLHKLTYINILSFIKLINISYRRIRADLILTFDITNNLVDMNK